MLLICIVECGKTADSQLFDLPMMFITALFLHLFGRLQKVKIL